MLDGISWFFSNLFASVGRLLYALTHPGDWLLWVTEIGKLETPEAKASLMRFIYYGASVELIFVIFTVFVIVTAVGLARRTVLWGVVRGLEGFANFTGRLFAWAGLLMVLQQIAIVFLQRIFMVSEIGLELPGGFGFTKDLSWWSEELKLYNAMIVAMCVTYTFVQGGHVRVDLIYARVSFRAKKATDMFGSLFFMLPAAILTWLFAWFFFWRVMVVPNTSASDSLDKLLTKARALRWNVETIGFSPNGFDHYWMFKVLILSFVALTFIHGIAFFYRNLLEFIEGPASEGKYLQKDNLGMGEDAYEGTH